MTAFEFGRQLNTLIKKAAGPAGVSKAPSGFFNSFMNPPKPSAGSGAPTNSPYLNTLDRWYNPWTKQKVTERGETGLMRLGQGAMGVGAAAGAAAGGIAAAPALASAGNTAMAGLGTAGAAVGAGAQRATQAVGNAAQNAANFGSSMVARLHGSPMAEPVRRAYEHYERAIEPMERAGITDKVLFPMEMAHMVGHGLGHAAGGHGPSHAGVSH